MTRLTKRKNPVQELVPSFRDRFNRTPEMPLFGKSSKSPTEVVRNLKDDLLCLEKRAGDPKKLEKVRSSNHDLVFGTSRGHDSSVGKLSWIKVPRLEVQLN